MTVIDQYLEAVPSDAHKVFEQLRTLVHQIVPGAEEVISYGLPAFKLHGKVFFGFAVVKAGMSVYPFSGGILNQIPEDLKDYKTTKSAVQIPLDKPLPESLIQKIIALRLEEIANG